MIRNAVLHQHGQLPLLVDMQALPQAADVSIICTNVRTIDNKRPSFIDDGQAWFLIPLAGVSFVEVPRSSLTEVGADSPLDEETVILAGPPSDPEPLPLEEEQALALDTDEDLLARIRDL